MEPSDPPIATLQLPPSPRQADERTLRVLDRVVVVKVVDEALLQERVDVLDRGDSAEIELLIERVVLLFRHHLVH